jgi:hypothetical protein
MVNIILGYLDGKPKQLTPQILSSAWSMGRTFREGKPAYGIFVPGMSTGLNETFDSL